MADDTVLTANKLSNLANILYLTKSYCDKYGVTLCAGKTKLLRISKCDPNYFETFNPIIIDGQLIEFSEEAKHVGIIRSMTGNIPHLMKRISSQPWVLHCHLEMLRKAEQIQWLVLG